MKLYTLTILFFSVMTLHVSYAQPSYELPAGYNLFKDYDGYTPRADGDFDKDGVKDVAIICESEESEFDKIVAVYLSSVYFKKNAFFYFPTNSIHFNLIYNGSTLQIDEDDDYQFYSYKFQYFDYLEDMQLVNYGHEYYMRHPTMFMGKSDVNLIEGYYTYNNGSRQNFNPPTISLTNIDSYLEYLSYIGGDFNGASEEESSEAIYYNYSEPSYETLWDPLSCSPIEYGPVILSEPDIFQVHPDWVGGEVGESWSFIAKQIVLSDGMEYLEGELISPRGGNQENGPYYVLSSEWECSNY